MKGLLRSKLTQTLAAFIIIAVAIFVPLSGSILHSHAAAAAPATDPIIGDWNVTYGAPAVVTMTLSGGVYTVTAKTPVQVTGSSCYLPIGTIIATFSSTGGNAYSGQHGLWYTSDCSFGFWDPMSLTLSSDGNTLTGVLDGGYGTVIFTKAGGASCKTPPNAPQSVQNGALYGDGNGGGQVSVVWGSPNPTCDPVDHYNIVNIHADGSTGDTVASVSDTGASSYTTYLKGLNLCTFYRYGVVAVGADGQKSSIALPASPVFTNGRPKASPPVVTILLQGIGSELAGSSWNPTNTFYCTSDDGNNSSIQQNTTQGNMAASWLNVKDAGHADYAGPGAGNNLIDSAASTGGLVLPLSYVRGTALIGTATAPTFTVPSYTTTDVANANPNVVASYLNSLINDINRVFPSAKIIVVGHSNGGLIAQQWWANNTTFSPGPQHDVVQVFSLDSPINGLYAGTICIHPNISEASLCTVLQLLGTSKGLLAYYGSLWKNQSTNDPYWASQDSANQMWTPFVTFDDPLYDVGDYGATQSGAADTNIGFASQGLINQPDCVNLNWQSGCHLIGSDHVNGFTYNDGTSETFGAPGDLWVHSVVKNNAQVIVDVMKYVNN